MSSHSRALCLAPASRPRTPDCSRTPPPPEDKPKARREGRGLGASCTRRLWAQQGSHVYIGQTLEPAGPQAQPLQLLLLGPRVAFPPTPWKDEEEEGRQPAP